VSGWVAFSGIRTPGVRVFVNSPAVILLVDVSIAAAAQRFQQSDNDLPTSTITAQSSFTGFEWIEPRGHDDEAVQDEKKMSKCRGARVAAWGAWLIGWICIRWYQQGWLDDKPAPLGQQA
jgi:hypothetical protein